MAISVVRPPSPGVEAGWTDEGTNVKLTEETDTVTVGTDVVSSEGEKVRVSGKVRVDGADGVVLSERGFQSTGEGVSGVEGDARGLGATDLQVDRNASFKVASGAHSFVAGKNSTATGPTGVAIGLQCASQGIGSVALGDTCGAVSGGAAIGYRNSTNANYSVALGRDSRSEWSNCLALGGTLRNTAGDTQGGFLVGRARTTGTTPVTVTTDGSAPNSANSFELINQSTYFFDLKIIARVQGDAADRAVYRMEFIADKPSTAASGVAILGSPTKTVLYEDSPGFDIDVSVDTTLGSFDLQVTGEAGKDIHWVCFGTWVQNRKS